MDDSQQYANKSKQLNVSLMNTNFANGYLTLPISEADGEKKRFMEQLNGVMNDIGKSITKMPVMGYRELDLFHFYNEVQANGGYAQVTDKVGTWSKIWKKLGNFDTSITDASFRLKKNYERFLLEYEYRQYPDRRRDETKTRPKRSRHSKNKQQQAPIVGVSPASIVQNSAAREPDEIGMNQKRRKVSSSEDLNTEFASVRPIAASNEAITFGSSKLFTNIQYSSANSQYPSIHDQPILSPEFNQSPDCVLEHGAAMMNTVKQQNYQKATAITPIFLNQNRFEPDSSLLYTESLDMTIVEDCLFPEITNFDEETSFGSSDDFQDWFK